MKASEYEEMLKRGWKKRWEAIKKEGREKDREEREKQERFNAFFKDLTGWGGK